MQVDTAQRLPIFEVVTPAANAAARRLTTATKVQTMLGIGTTDTTLIEQLIDFVSANAVRYCGLARPVSGTNVPTFGSETVRATFMQSLEWRGTRLILPWRTPITSISSVTEDGITLTVNTDYKLVEGNMLERFLNDAPTYWSTAKVIVNYVAGWSLPDGVPAEIEGAVIEQVKYQYLSRDRDQSLRSENVPDVYAATYSVPGGDAISKNGLMTALENALSAFKDWSAV